MFFIKQCTVVVIIVKLNELVLCFRVSDVCIASYGCVIAEGEALVINVVMGFCRAFTHYKMCIK